VRLADEVFDSDDCVTFIFEDDQLKPQLTITAAHKLIGTDHIDGMISFGTPTSLAVAPLFERQHIPLVAVTVLKRVNAGYKSVLRHFPDTAEEVRQNSSLLRKRMVGCSSIFVKDVRRKARWSYPIARPSKPNFSGSLTIIESAITLGTKRRVSPERFPAREISQKSLSP
jgi:hypothetical protein